MADWKFCGRTEQLADLERMLDRHDIIPQDLNDLTRDLS
jgi:hypothetical protein